MSSLIECIDGALDAQTVTDQMANDLKNRIKQFTDKHLNDGLDPAAARRMAQVDAIESKAAELALQKRQKALQVITLKAAIDEANAHPKGFARGVVSLITKDIQDMLSKTNIDYRAKTVEGRFHMKIARAMNEFRTKNLGLKQNQVGMRDVVREIEGVNTGNAQAKKFAEQISEVFEEARLRFNRAGGAIRKLDNWFPHWWDPKLVAKMGKERFIKEFGEKIDRTRMLDDLGLPLNNAEFAKVMAQMFDDISTDGISSLVPGRQGGKKLANKHQEKRVMIFNDVEDWLTLNDQFGRPDFYATMMGHLSNMSHEISMMEILGPSPEASFKYLRDMAQKKGASEPRLMSLDTLWKVASGKVNQVVWTKAADVSKSIRAVLVSAQLGSAFLSSLNDPWIARMTAHMNGIPSMKVFHEALRQFNPRNAEDRIFAVEMGLVADAWISRALAANRYTEITGDDFIAKTADAVMRASLLSPWTDALRKGFGMANFSQLAKDSSKAFADLPARRRAALERYKITEKEWDLIRSTEAIEHKGARYWSIENMMTRTDLDEVTKNNLATKVHEMVLSEIDHAVLMPDFRSQAIATLGTKRGGAGEIIRNVAMYKSFPILMIMKQLYRGASQKGLKNKAAYLSQLTIGLTVFGAISVQAKEIARGKDPRDMTDPKFWQAAFLQGGGAGIFGDFLFSDVNRFGNSMTSTIAGPWWGAIDDVTQLTLGQVQKLIAGKDTNISADMIQFLRRYTPGGSIWYTRAVWERGILDQLQEMSDPSAYQKFNKQIKRRQKDYGQQYWWRPGDSAPSRAPNLNAAGG